MSVYTSIIEQDLLGFINNFGLGSLVSFEGIQDGIANSNYAVSTTQGEFVLTIFETLNFQQVSRYVQLLERLGQYNSLYPVPQADKSAQYVRICITSLRLFATGYQVKPSPARRLMIANKSGNSWVSYIA